MAHLDQDQDYDTPMFLNLWWIDDPLRKPGLYLVRLPSGQDQLMDEQQAARMDPAEKYWIPPREVNR